MLKGSSKIHNLLLCCSNNCLKQAFSNILMFPLTIQCQQLTSNFFISNQCLRYFILVINGMKLYSCLHDIPWDGILTLGRNVFIHKIKQQINSNIPKNNITQRYLIPEKNQYQKISVFIECLNRSAQTVNITILVQKKLSILICKNSFYDMKYIDNFKFDSCFYLFFFEYFHFNSVENEEDMMHKICFIISIYLICFLVI